MQFDALFVRLGRNVKSNWLNPIFDMIRLFDDLNGIIQIMWKQASGNYRQDSQCIAIPIDEPLEFFFPVSIRSRFVGVLNETFTNRAEFVAFILNHVVTFQVILFVFSVVSRFAFDVFRVLCDYWNGPSVTHFYPSFSYSLSFCPDFLILLFFLFFFFLSFWSLVHACDFTCVHCSSSYAKYWKKKTTKI